MNNKFTKTDLRKGMIIECRNGNRFGILDSAKPSGDSTAATPEHSDIINLSLYNDELEHCENYELDIVEVRRTGDTDSITRVFKKFSSRRFSGDGVYDLYDISNLFRQHVLGEGYSELELIWKRED